LESAIRQRLAWIPDERVVYGATLQVLERQCNPALDQFLVYSGALPAGVTSGSIASLCALTFSGPATAAEYKSLLATVALNSTVVRGHTSIAYVLWPTNAAKFVYDAEQRSRSRS